MYKPLFNQVLVEVDTESDKWGRGNDDSMLGKDYREGTVKDIGLVMSTKDFPIPGDVLESFHESLLMFVGAEVMWHQGHEAGQTFEEDGKLYALIHWFDLIGVKE